MVPLAAGGYIVRGPIKPGQRIRVVGHLKAKPDTKKLAKAIIELAEEQTRRDSKKRP